MIGEERRYYCNDPKNLVSCYVGEEGGMEAMREKPLKKRRIKINNQG